MSLRRTRGIVTDRFSSDPGAESDVIMTAAALGLASDYIATRKRPLQFDMDPLDANQPNESAKKALFENTETLGQVHPKGKEIALKTALLSVSIPLHPGAEKYYREAGVLKK